MMFMFICNFCLFDSLMLWLRMTTLLQISNLQKYIQIGKISAQYFEDLEALESGPFLSIEKL